MFFPSPEESINSFEDSFELLERSLKNSEGDSEIIHLALEKLVEISRETPLEEIQRQNFSAVRVTNVLNQIDSLVSTSQKTEGVFQKILDFFGYVEPYDLKKDLEEFLFVLDKKFEDAANDYLKMQWGQGYGFSIEFASFMFDKSKKEDLLRRIINKGLDEGYLQSAFAAANMLSPGSEKEQHLERIASKALDASECRTAFFAANATSIGPQKEELLRQIANKALDVRDSRSLTLTANSMTLKEKQEFLIKAENLLKNCCMRFDQNKYQDKELPNTYFQDQTQVVVKESVEVIEKAIESGSENYFEELIEIWGAKRLEIAEIQTSSYSRFFGKLRLPNNNNELYTPLTENDYYVEYGEKFTRLIEIGDPKGCFEEKENDYIFKLEKKGKMKWNQLNESDSDLIFCSFSRAFTKYGRDKENLLYVQKTLVNEGQTFHLASYLVLIEEEGMSVGLKHANTSDLERLKSLMATCFKECIKSEDLTDLKEKVALFRYLFAHAAPYCRGSASIAEWAEKAIYLYHKYTIQYQIPEAFRPKEAGFRPTADLDALTALSFSDFKEDYLSKIRLKSLSVDEK